MTTGLPPDEHEGESAPDLIGRALESALGILGIAADTARDENMTTMATSINAVMRQVEDLRARVEEFDLSLLDPQYPLIIRSNGVPRATRIAMARDGSSAIYKRIDSRGNPFRTPFFSIYPYAPGSTVTRNQQAEPVSLVTLPDPDKYVWDAPEELTASNPRHVTEED